MGKSPMRIAMVLTVGVFLGLVAVLRPRAVESAPREQADGSAPAEVAAQPPANVDAKQPSAVLFKNVKVFDGKADKLTTNTSVLVVGNKIEKIGGDIAAPIFSKSCADSLAIASRFPDSTVLNGSVLFNAGFCATTAGTRSRQNTNWV